MKKTNWLLFSVALREGLEGKPMSSSDVYAFSTKMQKDGILILFIFFFWLKNKTKQKQLRLEPSVDNRS